MRRHRVGASRTIAVARFCFPLVRAPLHTFTESWRSGRRKPDSESGRTGQDRRSRRPLLRPSVIFGRSACQDTKGFEMKTMTCKQLGGACDLPLTGGSGDDIIKAQDRHLKDSVAAGDSAHDKALHDMKNRWKNPVAGLGWYRQVKREFKALPDA